VTFYCIGDEDTVRGFRLAGVNGDVVGSPREAAEALDGAVSDTEIGVLIVTDVVAEGIRDRIEELRLAATRPLVVEIPGPEGPLPGRKTLRRFVQEAVGIRVGREEAD
jgi:V/A-type H+/Na+-transporting ATPase subunit F